MAEPFSRRLLVASAVARAWALKTAEGGTSEPKKIKKKIDDDEIRTHAILEGFNPFAEIMDFVSHFLSRGSQPNQRFKRLGSKCLSPFNHSWHPV